LQPNHGRRELGGAPLLLIDHGRRRPRNEAGIRELGLGLRDLALQPLDLLVEPVALGSSVDLDVQRQAHAAG